GYKKIRYYTHENIGYGPVNLPDQELHTTAVWWQLPQALLLRAFASGGYADLYNIHRWTLGFVGDSPQGARYRELSEKISEALT
ncbi:3-deoxy-7-phosphoheptulonate synthase, partial [Variovorax sp. 2RAF20]